MSFDHLTVGTAESAWELSEVARIPGPAAGARVVVLGAHPDDETLGAGGLIAAAARAGADVRVVVATDGEASHPHSPTHPTPPRAPVRRVEAQAAVGLLAPDADVQFLGLPDGGLERCDDELARSLARLLDGATLIVSPWAGDRHPDHETVARVAAELARQVGAEHWQYPIWAWHWADPTSADLPRDRLRALALDESTQQAKSRAMACHVSQHAPLSCAAGDEAILPPAVLAHFQRPFEAFVVEPDRQDASDGAYFERLYAAADDPWGLAQRFYEQRKRSLLLAALPRPRFRRAFEPGCATGLLTTRLARRCDEVVAWDVVESAVEQTRLRVADQAVTVRRAGIPEQWPDGVIDLIVLSEVGYYVADLGVLGDRILASLADDGVVVACHWRHPAPDHPHHAEDVHAVLDALLPCTVRHLEDDFLLQVWSSSGDSVARAEGIVA